MTKKEERTYGLFHIFEEDDAHIEMHSISNDVDDLKSFLHQINFEDLIEGREQHFDTSDLEEEEIDVTRTDEFGKHLWSAFEDLYGYYDLLVYFTDIMPQMGRAIFETSVVNFAKKNFKIVDTVNGAHLYEIDNTDIFRIHRNIERVNRFNDSGAKIRSSILLSLIATFDAVFSDLCKYLMRGIKEKYEGSDRKYTVEEILSLESVDDLVEKVISDEVDHIMNGSHSDQVKFFEKTFNLSFIEIFPRWPEYIEIFERRNLAAHGDLKVNKFYIDKCRAAGYKNLPHLGQKLEIDRKYMGQAVDLLIEVLVLLGFQAWRKRSPDQSAKAFSLIVNMSFELVKNGNPQPALHIAMFALGINDRNCDAVTKNMIAVNAAIALKLTDETERAHQLLDDIDWSAASALLKLCVHSLKGEVPDAITHLEAAKVSNEIDIVCLREWPVFEWVRSDSDFQTAVEDVFDESIVKSTATVIEDSSEPRRVEKDRS